MAFEVAEIMKKDIPTKIRHHGDIFDEDSFNMMVSLVRFGLVSLGMFGLFWLFFTSLEEEKR